MPCNFICSVVTSDSPFIATLINHNNDIIFITIIKSCIIKKIMLKTFYHNSTLDIPDNIMMHQTIISSTITIKPSTIFYCIMEPVISYLSPGLLPYHTLDKGTITLHVTTIRHIIKFYKSFITRVKGSRSTKFMHCVVFKYIV